MAVALCARGYSELERLAAGNGMELRLLPDLKASTLGSIDIFFAAERPAAIGMSFALLIEVTDALSGAWRRSGVRAKADHTVTA